MVNKIILMILFICLSGLVSAKPVPTKIYQLGQIAQLIPQKVIGYEVKKEQGQAHNCYITLLRGTALKGRVYSLNGFNFPSRPFHADATHPHPKIIIGGTFSQEKGLIALQNESQGHAIVICE